VAENISCIFAILQERSNFVRDLTINFTENLSELLVVGIAGVCRSPSPAVFSPSSNRLSVFRDLQKYQSIPGWLEVGSFCSWVLDNK